MDTRVKACKAEEGGGREPLSTYMSRPLGNKRMEEGRKGLLIAIDMIFSLIYYPEGPTKVLHLSDSVTYT